MAALASSFSYRFTYDVFLSFRGGDTRYGFTGNLYKALHDRGIHTFMDEEELQRGEEITVSLEKAIEESRIGIIVFSKNYASSSFCLRELVKILECIKGKGRLVLPVFYKVDPSDVRHLRGTYGEALLGTHEDKFKEKARKALHRAANLSGWHIDQRHEKYEEKTWETINWWGRPMKQEFEYEYKQFEYEYKLIERIVKFVSSKINRDALYVADFPVGLESQVQEVIKLLDVGYDDGVYIVGIHGLGGIGKTTLARAVYNLIADSFEGLCFLENVRENSIKHGLKHLQEMLLSKLVGDKYIAFASVNEGITIIKHRLQQKKVLVILDDVDERKQLLDMVGGLDWFGPGSRVIITTRDKHLLACHGVERTYEVEVLNEEKALELFRWNAFKNNKIDVSYENILNRAVTYASSLPLALEVIGSNLFQKSIEVWESALHQYERIPNKEIQNILKVSFDALEEGEQEIFLDIACCFKGYNLVELQDILHAHCGDNMKYHIEVLIEKSLIKINQVGHVTLHDLIEDMGKEIVRQGSPKEPGKRSRLWFHKDIVQVLEDNTGTSKIEIIYLDFPMLEEEVIEWNTKAFKKMKHLKTLIIKNGHFSKGPKHLPSSLRILEWWRYPSQCLPSDFHPKKLTICKFPNGFFTSIDFSGLQKKELVNLRVLNFDLCESLTQISDISCLPNLEKLSLQYCHNLHRIHQSVGFLYKLKKLSALGCSKLRSFPPIILTSLEQFELSDCYSLESFPEILGKMENIKRLSLEDCPIKELPFSVHNLNRLQELELGHCGTVQLPTSIAMMPELAMITAWEWKGQLLPKCEEKVSSMVSSSVERLWFSNCNLSDEFLPIVLTWFANVTELNLSRNNFTILPECINECHLLRKLILDYCEHLREIRGIPPNLDNFSAGNCISLTSACRSMLLNQELHEAGNTMFCLPGARIPEWFKHHSRSLSISFWFRNKFPAIALSFVIGPMSHGSNTFRASLIINGKKCLFDHPMDGHYLCMEMDHTYLFDLQRIKMKDNLEEVHLENEWNHVNISYKAVVMGWEENFHEIPILIESGIHVFEQRSVMEDIQFTNPYRKRKLEDDLNSSESQNYLLLKRQICGQGSF